jgi:hypothetical protein
MVAAKEATYRMNKPAFVPAKLCYRFIGLHNCEGWVGPVNFFKLSPAIVCGGILALLTWWLCAPPWEVPVQGAASKQDDRA